MGRTNVGKIVDSSRSDRIQPSRKSVQTRMAVKVQGVWTRGRSEERSNKGGLDKKSVYNFLLRLAHTDLLGFNVFKVTSLEMITYCIFVDGIGSGSLRGCGITSA